MPKVNPPDFIVRQRYSASLIDQKITANGTTPRQVAAGIKMPSTTFYTKKKDPGTFTVEQAARLARVLGWSDRELLSFIKGRAVNENP